MQDRSELCKPPQTESVAESRRLGNEAIRCQSVGEWQKVTCDGLKARHSRFRGACQIARQSRCVRRLSPPVWKPREKPKARRCGLSLATWPAIGRANNIGLCG